MEYSPIITEQLEVFCIAELWTLPVVFSFHVFPLFALFAFLLDFFSPTTAFKFQAIHKQSSFPNTFSAFDMWLFPKFLHSCHLWSYWVGHAAAPFFGHRKAMGNCDTGPSLSSEGCVLGLDTAVFWSHIVVNLHVQVLPQGGDALLGL